MSLLIHPVSSLLNNAIYYSVYGLWWGAKRLIWGRELTPEEKIQKQQQEIMSALKNQTDIVNELTEEQRMANLALEQQQQIIYEQRNMIEQLIHNRNAVTE